MTIYSGGLRINEAVHLKVTDIDSSRMVIRVRHGKGKKDRYTLLAQRTLEELRHYWKQSHPVDWLFPGKDRSVPLSVSSVQKAFKEALIRTGIKKAVSVHTLRHSFKSSAETISEISRDERYLGAETGCIAILHTWLQSLIDHPHIHCIVTGGGSPPTGRNGLTVQKDYFAPVKVLSRLFRGKFLYHLTKATASGDLTYSGEIAFLKDREPFRRYVTGLYRRERVVYCKKPFRNTNHVLEYLGRYTHRVAISNNRIVRVGANDVTFRVRDPAEVGTTKLMTLDTFEFIRRFLLHILPDRFMKIRYYGLLSNRNRKIKLARCRQLFGMPEHPEDHDAPKERWEETFLRVTGIDLRICPHCDRGTMVRMKLFRPHVGRWPP